MTQALPPSPFPLFGLSLNWRRMWKGEGRSPGIGGSSLSFIRIILTLQRQEKPKAALTPLMLAPSVGLLL